MTETREKYKLLYRRLWHIIEIADNQESLIDDAEYRYKGGLIGDS